MPTSPTLRSLVRLWLAVAAAIVALTVVAVVLADRRSGLPAALPVALAAAGGIGAVVGVLAVDRTFSLAAPDDDAAALAELRTRAFLQLAIAEAPVLLAFALAFAFGPGWVTIVGAVAGLAALTVSRPTRSRLRRIDDAWARQGAPASLQRALAADAAPTTDDAPPTDAPPPADAPTGDAPATGDAPPTRGAGDPP